MKAAPENKEKGKAVVPKNTVYAKMRQALYNAVENNVKFNDKQFDTNGKCYLSRTMTDCGYDQYTRGMIAAVQRKANNKGWVVYFTLAMPTANENTVKLYGGDNDPPIMGFFKPRKGNSIFMRGLPIKLTINETPSGVKLLWFVKDKPQWGMSTAQAINVHLYSMVGLVLDLFTQIENWYSPADFIPIAKYLRHSSVDNNYYGDMAYGFPNEWINKLSGGTNPRDILNKAYGKSGQQGLSKNAFGGVANFTSVEQLATAYKLVSCLRSFPSHFFDRIKITDTEKMLFPSASPAGLPLTKYFFKYFNHKKILDDAVEYISKADRRANGDSHLIHPDEGHVDFDYDFFSTSSMMIYSRDAGSMLQQITDRTVRKNIIAFKGNIRETHDLILSEFNKLTTEDNKIKYKKKHVVLDNQMVTNNIVSVLPKTTHDLISWGSDQHNCIGSYGNRVIQSSKTIIVGFKNQTTNDWVGHAELSNTKGGWIITQLRGKYNIILEDEDDKAIRKFINGVFDNWKNI